MYTGRNAAPNHALEPTSLAARVTGDTPQHDRTSPVLLFVYGTLRLRAENPLRELMAQYAEFVAEGSYQGRLYRVDSYPAAIPSPFPADRVQGDIFALRAPQILLPELDRYEECGPGFTEPTEYIRCREPIRRADGQWCQAWLYRYNRPIDNLTRITTGNFLADPTAPEHSQPRAINSLSLPKHPTAHNG